MRIGVGYITMSDGKMHFQLRPSSNAPLLRLTERICSSSEGVEKACAYAAETGVKLSRAVVAIDGSQCFLRNYRFPISGRKQLDQAVRFEFEGELPIDAEELVTDYFRGGSWGKDSYVCAAAVRKSMVASLVAEYRERGVVPLSIDVDVASFSRACAASFPQYERFVGLDIGENRTLFCLVVKGKVRSLAIFPVGESRLVASFAAAADVSGEEVDRFLLLGSGAGHAKDYGGLVQTELVKFIQGLLREVFRQLGKDEWPAHFVVSGEVVRAQGFRAAFEETSGGGLDIWEESCLNLGDEVDEGQRGCGLAVGFGAPESGGAFNFLKGEFAVGETGWVPRDLILYGVLLSAIFLSWLAYAYASMVSNDRELRYLNTAMEQVYRDALPDVGVEMALEQYRSILESRVGLITEGLGDGGESALPVIEVLRTISRALGKKIDVEFISLSLDSKQFTIQGESRSMSEVDEVRNGLNAAKTFKEVKVRSAVSDKQTKKIRFEIEVTR